MSGVAVDASHLVDPRRWAALVILLIGSFLSPLDFFIVNLALPSIRGSLGAGPAVAQMVISGYAIAFAVLLVTSGRLGDLYGRKRFFIGGLLGFAASSALCGLAWSPLALIIGRVLQGTAAAIIVPQTLASIHVLFPAREKARVLGFYGATFGLASVAGTILGGVLIAANPFGLGWRSIFLVNLPVVAAAVPGAWLLLRESRSPHPARLDVSGALLLAAALLCLVVPLIEGHDRGWPAWSFAMLIAVVPLLLIFWKHEHRVVRAGGDPLVLPSLFAVPGLGRGLAATLLFYIIGAFFMIFAVYEQAGRGQTPLQSGLALLPHAIGFMLGPLASPWCNRRLGRRRTPAAGMMVEAFGLFVVALTAQWPLHWIQPLALLAVGLGQGVGLPTLVRVVVERVDSRWAGLAAGLVNSALQVSGALGVAMIGGLFYAQLRAHSDPTGIAHAFAVATAAIGVFTLIGAWLVNGVQEVHEPAHDNAHDKARG